MTSLIQLNNLLSWANSLLLYFHKQFSFSQCVNLRWTILIKVMCHKIFVAAELMWKKLSRSLSHKKCDMTFIVIGTRSRRSDSVKFEKYIYELQLPTISHNFTSTRFPININYVHKNFRLESLKFNHLQLLFFINVPITRCQHSSVPKLESDIGDSLSE